MIVFAALGVIVSLLFVAYEARRNTAEIKRTAWEANIDRFNAMWSRTSSTNLAEIRDRGRQDFADTRGLLPVMMSAMEQASNPAD